MTQDQEYRWKCELEIIQSLDGKIPSSREMQRLLKEKYSLDVCHTQINKDLKLDLSSMTSKEYENQKDGIMSMIDKLINIANNIATSGENDGIRLKAMNTVSKLSKTKSDILSQFRRTEAEKQDDKPIYNIFIGQPKETDVKKFEKLEMKKDGEDKN
jgi:hypothetical protein